MADYDMGADLFTLTDEEGVEQTFELMDTYEDKDGNVYYALVPYYENPEEMVEADTELVILKSEDDGDEETLASIDDDDEYERIGKIFMDRLFRDVRRRRGIISRTLCITTELMQIYKIYPSKLTDIYIDFCSVL